MVKAIANIFFDEFVDPFSPGNSIIRAEHYMRYLFAADYFRKHFPAKSTVLDLGCGNGYGSHILDKAGFRVIGVDSSEVLLTEAKKRYPSLQWIKKDLETTSLADLTHPDAIACFEVLEHLADPDKVLNECFCLLPKDGILILSVPNERYEPKKKGKAKNRFHKQLFSSSSLKKAVTAAGFTVIGSLGQPKANTYYHHLKRVLPLIDKVTSHVPVTLRALSPFLASVAPDPKEKSYSIILLCQKKS